MKKTYIALIAVAVGFILIGVGLKFNKGKCVSVNYSFDKQSANYGDDERKTYECKKDVSEIKITESSNTIRIETGSVSVPTISYMEGENEGIVNISESGSNCSFTRQHTNVVTIGLFNFEDDSTILTLPKDYAGELTLKTSSGSIHVTGDLDIKELKTNSSSGSIYIEETSTQKSMEAESASGSITIKEVSACDDFTAKASSGSIRINNVNANGEASVRTTSGSINIDNLNVKKGLELESTSGTITPDYVTVGNDAYFHASSGGIHFKDLSAGNDITLSASSGSINGNILGKESDYSIMSSTTSGSCNLTDSRDGAHNLDVSTKSGSIRITFR